MPPKVTWGVSNDQTLYILVGKSAKKLPPKGIFFVSPNVILGVSNDQDLHIFMLTKGEKSIYCLVKWLWGSPETKICIFAKNAKHCNKLQKKQICYCCLKKSFLGSTMIQISIFLGSKMPKTADSFCWIIFWGIWGLIPMAKFAYLFKAPKCQKLQNLVFAPNGPKRHLGIYYDQTLHILRAKNAPKSKYCHLFYLRCPQKVSNDQTLHMLGSKND